MILWLIGMMGVGKTTVGRLLASQLGYAHVDTDEAIAARVGRAISEFWEDEGESAFRDVEREAILSAAGLDEAVVSTGGGAPLDHKNQQTMESTGKIVWLRASSPTIWARVGATKTRPLLEENRPEALASLVRVRREVYESVADMTVDTDEKTVLEVTAEVARWWLS